MMDRNPKAVYAVAVVLAIFLIITAIFLDFIQASAIIVGIVLIVAIPCEAAVYFRVKFDQWRNSND